MAHYFHLSTADVPQIFLLYCQLQSSSATRNTCKCIRARLRGLAGGGTSSLVRLDVQEVPRHDAAT
jgi:hypothetical protein